jgi:hypothetical protein
MEQKPEIKLPMSLAESESNVHAEVTFMKKAYQTALQVIQKQNEELEKLRNGKTEGVPPEVSKIVS